MIDEIVVVLFAALEVVMKVIVNLIFKHKFYQLVTSVL